MPRSRKKSKNRIVKKSSIFNREYFLFLVKKIGLVSVVAVLLFWLSAWFFLSDMDSQTKDWGHQKVLQVSNYFGLTLKNLNVEGRYYADPKSILQAVQLEKGDPLLAFKSDEAYKSLSNLEWIRDVSIRRIFPNTIYVRLEENIPLAIYKNGDKLALIDVYGEEITQKNLGNFKDMIVVTGEDADNQAPELIKNLKASSSIFNIVETAQFIGGRRWDLYLQNDLQVKLPDDNVALALSTLSKMQSEDNIMEKNLSVIDMRDLSRIVVKTKSGEQFEASSNNSAGNLI